MGPRKRPSTVSAVEDVLEAAKHRAEPYTKIVEELPQMRREAVNLVRQAVSQDRYAYVLDAYPEGAWNSPLT